MKVLMINVVCGIRSTGRICTDLAVELEKQGHEVKIAYGRENVPKQFQKYAVRIGTDLDVKLHGIKARLLDGAGFGSKNATVKFIRWIKEYDPDVIHLNNIHGYYINIEVLFKYLRICGKKIIWTLHDCWSFTGHSAYCDAVQCERWVQGCYKCPQRKEYPKSIIDASRGNWIKKKKIFSDIPNMTIITPSNWLAELVKKSFLGKYPVEVIHNGIDTNQFKPLKNDFREVYHLEDKFIVLGIATVWNDMKGYSDFIKLASMLDDFYKIVMVGLTEEQIEKLMNYEETVIELYRKSQKQSNASIKLTKVELLQKQLEEKQREIDTLRQQVKDKDKQLTRQSETIVEFANKFATLADQAQKLNLADKKDVKNLDDPSTSHKTTETVSETVKETPKKQSWFKRIWGK